MTELKKMLASELYYSNDESLYNLRIKCRELIRTYNLAEPSDNKLKTELLQKLLGKYSGKCEIEPNFFCDYGFNIELEENVFINFNCVFLDCAKIKIGKNVLIGPNVQIYTAGHPVDAGRRISGLEFAKPVTIEDNVWIGGSAVINPGVTIGKNSIIGSGSIVTKDIPENVIAAGNPCRIIKTIDETKKI